MKRKVLLVLVLVSITVIAVVSARKQEAFSAAADFPRAPLMYAQVTDLPALIKTLKAADASAKYLESENYSDFMNRHLGLKLASRWKEFNEGAGFDFDLETVSGFADNRAAIAVYDIGRLEFVFVAPVSDKLFAATMLMKDSDGRFTSEEYDGGIKVYRTAIEADRGRQKQELLFTNIKGRLVIATSEKLLVRTIDNISGKDSNDRLTDDPAFSRLRETLSPHTFTVWLNQTALNSDYYFKRYWLMSSLDDLKNYEAALCDFSLEKTGVIEDRRFLLKEPAVMQDIGSRKIAAAMVHLPGNIPYYRLRTAAPETISEAISQTLDDKKDEKAVQKRNTGYSFGDEEYEYEYDGQLDSRFDTAINEEPEDETTAAAAPADNPADPGSALDSAVPESVLTFTRPVMQDAPLFAEFKRGAVFHLASPAGFDRNRFESAIRDRLLTRVTVAAAGAQMAWTTKGKNGAWRQLDLPMLAWSVCYKIRGNDLFLTNDPGLLGEALAAKSPLAKENDSLSERSVLLLPETSGSYDALFEKLATAETSEDFFTGNIKSLFESMPAIKRIEFERGYSGDLLREKISLSIE
jgi:hypothetical protein